MQFIRISIKSKLAGEKLDIGWRCSHITFNIVICKCGDSSKNFNFDITQSKFRWTQFRIIIFQILFVLVEKTNWTKLTAAMFLQCYVLGVDMQFYFKLQCTIFAKTNIFSESNISINAANYYFFWSCTNQQINFDVDVSEI